MSFDATSVFGEAEDDFSLNAAPQPSMTSEISVKRTSEVILLAATALAVVVAGVIASLNAGAFWLVGYVTAVVLGVSTLGFYRQAVAKRQAMTHVLATRGQMRLQVLLGICLLLAALGNAIRLAVLWS